MGSSALPCGFHGRADDGGLDERQLVGCILRIDAAARDERELRDFAHAADGLERRGGAGVRSPVMMRASAPHSVATRALSSMEMALLSMTVCFVWISHRRAMFSAPSSLR